MDESEIQSVVSVVVKTIRTELEPANIPKHVPKIDNFVDPVVAKVKGTETRTKIESNEKMLLNFKGETPVSDSALDIFRTKAFPSAPGNLHTVLESLRQNEARFEEAEILELEEMSNSPKCVPETINKAPEVGEVLVNPDCKKRAL